MNAASPLPPLIDRFGRQVRYVRLSVTDRCDFRCVYCMAEEMTFLPRQQILSLEEIAQVGRAFVSMGVEKIRLTGGEPLVRNNILWLVEQLAHLPGLRELTLTTNGSQLAKLAADLKKAGLSRINVSLDSLDPQRFRALTRTGDLARVLEGIEAAKDAGFQRIKINSVILRQRNDDEILPLVAFARQHALDLCFIEEMPLGTIDEHDRATCYMPSDEIREIIKTRYSLLPSEYGTGGPARYFAMTDSPSRIGFISPHSHNFCGDCNRVRVTAEGRLLLCLGNEHSVDLRSVLRNFPDDMRILQQTLRSAMEIKPERHYFDLNDTPQIVRFMNMTGG
jgi:cyclic pyranopterin phosphate synthase